jgi:S-adenosylmethionine synthetase
MSNAQRGGKPRLHETSSNGPKAATRSAEYDSAAVLLKPLLIVAAGLAESCEIQVAYAIGVAHPLSVFVETFGTGNLPDEQISSLVEEIFDLRPGAIIRDLKLRRHRYRAVASYGHFGREDLDLPWEQLTKLDELKDAAGVLKVTA